MVKPGLIDTDDSDRPFLVTGIGAGDSGAEEHLVPILLPRRVDHFGDRQALAKKAYPPIDFAQPSLSVDIVAVFRTVAVTGGPGYDLDHLWTFNRPQLTKFILKSL